MIEHLLQSIRADLFKALYKRVLKLITVARKNMKNYLINLADKNYLGKDFVLKLSLDFSEVFYKPISTGNEVGLKKRSNNI